VNVCENQYRCDWAEVCKDGTKHNSLKCLATREKCPACGLPYGKHLGINGICRALQEALEVVRLVAREHCNPCSGNCAATNCATPKARALLKKLGE
jgi:hypothetical protein